jgi:hypothetical protein
MKIHLQPLFITTLHTSSTIQKHIHKLKQANHDYQKVNQPKLNSLSINFVHQPHPPNNFILTFLWLEHEDRFSKHFLPIHPPPSFQIQLKQFCLKEFWGFFDFRFNQKIRVWGYFNWGRTLPLIIGRIFGNFGVWIKDCKIRVPILYIWGRNSHWGRETLGKMTFLHFLQISQISPWKCWLQSAILVPACVASDMAVHVRG